MSAEPEVQSHEYTAMSTEGSTEHERGAIRTEARVCTGGYLLGTRGPGLFSEPRLKVADPFFAYNNFFIRNRKEV